MTASNINIDEFINILVNIRNAGSRLINLDMLPDENHPSMNKLVIHPVKDKNVEAIQDQPEEQKFIIRNPDIRTDNNDIFNKFNELL